MKFLNNNPETPECHFQQPDPKPSCQVSTLKHLNRATAKPWTLNPQGPKYLPILFWGFLIIMSPIRIIPALY